MSTAHRSRKPRPPKCDLYDEENAVLCVGRAEVILVGRDGETQRVCPAHGAALWLTDPAIRFTADTRPEAIAAVLRHAFGGSR